MTTFIKKIKFLLCLLGTVSIGYSYADLDSATCTQNSCYCPCQTPRTQGFIGAEFLYWRAFQDGMDTCNPTDVSDTVLSDGRIISTFEGKGKDPTFDWNPGFRIGAGIELECNQWEVGALWTHFNSKAHRSLSEDNPLRWKINLDVIDLLFAYPFDLNSCFSMRPYLGVKAARIDQKLRLGGIPDATTFAVSDETLFGANNKHKFEGVGPLFGLEVDLQATDSFSFYANGAISWLYGRHDVRLTNSIATINVIDFSNIKNKTGSTLMAADASFGIRWQTCFCGDKQLSVQLGYEFHRFFDYNRIDKCGDLSFDGLSLGMGIGL